VLEKMMRGVPEEERRLMETGNCVEFYRLKSN
jgi:hypothetical protein